jgi:hypothetical protein
MAGRNLGLKPQAKTERSPFGAPGNPGGSADDSSRSGGGEPALAEFAQSQPGAEGPPGGGFSQRDQRRGLKPTGYDQQSTLTGAPPAAPAAVIHQGGEPAAASLAQRSRGPSGPGDAGATTLPLSRGSGGGFSSSLPQALAGVRVLDLATFIAAPFAAGLLAELGAEVIKVEQPGGGDPIRELGTKVNGRALFWALEGRGQELALELIRRADVVVENFRPGTLERWNLGYDRMREVNPGVVLLRVSAYGQYGPYASRPGFGRIAQAFGGLT